MREPTVTLKPPSAPAPRPPRPKSAAAGDRRAMDEDGGALPDLATPPVANSGRSPASGAAAAVVENPRVPPLLRQVFAAPPRRLREELR